MRLSSHEQRRVLSSIVFMVLMMSAGLVYHRVSPSDESIVFLKPCREAVVAETVEGVRCFPSTDRIPFKARQLHGLHAFVMGRLLDLNIAKEEDLTVVPGIGPRLAERIMTYRKVQGRFSNLDEIERVKGIGPRLKSRLAKFVRVNPISPE